MRSRTIVLAIKDNSSGNDLTVKDIVEALNSRGFGPLLIGPALITILPTGAIPFVPNITALLMVLIAAQILLGRYHPWIPKRLGKMSIDRDTFLDSLKKAKPYTKKIDQYTYPRLTFLIDKHLEPLIAIMCILLAASIFLLAIIPFMAAIPSIGILLLGLSLTARDGLLMLLSLAFVIGTGVAIPYVWSAVFGG